MNEKKCCIGASLEIMKLIVFCFVSLFCFIGVSATNSSQTIPKESPNLITKTSEKEGENSKTTLMNLKRVVCPKVIERMPFFSLPCDYDSECKVFGSRMVCCSNRCIRGEDPPMEKEPIVEKSSQIKTISTTTQKRITNKIVYICPKKNVPLLIFSLPCETDSDCTIFGSKMVCCSGRCTDGVPTKIEEQIQLVKNETTKRNDVVAKSSDQPLKVQIQKIVAPAQNKTSNLLCPEDARVPFFALLCTNDNDCSGTGDKMICCKNRCIAGVTSQKNQIISRTERISDKGDIKDKSANTSINTSITVPKVVSRNTTMAKLECPDKRTRIPFFSLPCVVDSDCASAGNGMVCCSSRCIKGVSPKKPDIEHSPSWFGLVERNCPVDAIVEILEIKECESDSDCRPRICCPDKYRSGGNKSYCRTPQPSLHRFPLAERATEPLRVFASYIQCTPPPPQIFDLFPKSCNNALDCFPNLCCQEGDKKYCRPPKRSLLQLIAGVGQRFVPPDAAKRLIERLN